MFVRDGPKNKPAPVWRESGRVVNWLSTLIILSSALLILVTTRIALKPVGIADVAGVWVKDAVCANNLRVQFALVTIVIISFEWTVFGKKNGKEEATKRHINRTGAS